MPHCVHQLVDNFVCLLGEDRQVAGSHQQLLVIVTELIST